MKIIIIPLLLMTFVASAQDTTISKKVYLNKKFHIMNGQEVEVRGQKLSIKFSSVDNDSRCPTDVVCVWEGNAGIVIEVAKNRGKVVQAILNTNPSVKPNKLEYKKYRIKLLELDPYPKKEEQINPEDYEAVMVVTKQ